VLARADWHAAQGDPLSFRSHRVVTQAQHVWIVREADASLAANATGEHCLVCESALTVRCAWDYPRDWSRLSDRELLALFSHG
jgi:hypothetical protein